MTRGQAGPSARSSDAEGGSLGCLGTLGWCVLHQLGSRHLGVGTCAIIAICHAGHCMQRFVTAGLSPERHVQSPVRRPNGAFCLLPDRGQRTRESLEALETLV